MDAQARGGAGSGAEGLVPDRGPPRLLTSRGNRVALLGGARPTYDALERAIDSARRRAWLSIYAFHADSCGRPILTALERAASRGLDVRLVVDAFGSRGLERGLERLVARGAAAAVYRVPRRAGDRWPRLDARNHKKVAVLDSSVAFVGGVNVGDQFLDWRDLHVRVEGPAARDLEAVVLADYVDAGGARSRSAPAEAQRDGTSGGLRESLRTASRVARVDAAAELASTDGDADTGRFDVVTSRVPGQLHGVVHALLESARHRIRLTTPYFVPDRPLLDALLRAARAGVDVEVLTPRRSNWPMANWAGRSFYPALLEAGVRVAEHHEAMLHAKAIVVDSRVAAIGSPNFDARSFHINGEVLCLVHDRAVVAAIERSIEEDRRGARPVDLARFERRPRWDRAVEHTAAIFSRWL